LVAQSEWVDEKVTDYTKKMAGVAQRDP